MVVKAQILRGDGHEIEISTYPEQVIVRDDTTTESRGYRWDGEYIVMAQRIAADFKLPLGRSLTVLLEGLRRVTST